MPDTICMGDCFYQDDQGRIALRLDNETIQCVKDEATGLSQLVASSGIADCTPWPFSCAPSVAGQPIYCDEQGKLYAGLKPYYKSGEQGSYELIPNLGSLMGSTNQVLRSATTSYTNDDPCGRTVELNIDFLFNGFSFTVPAGAGLWLVPEYTIDGNQWIPIQGVGVINGNATPFYLAESATAWKRRVNVQAGQSITIGMRWRTGSAGQGHTAGQNFSATAESLYGFQIYWDARSIS